MSHNLEIPTENDIEALVETHKLSVEVTQLLGKKLIELLEPEPLCRLTSRAAIVANLYWSAEVESTTREYRFGEVDVDIFAAALFVALDQYQAKDEALQAASKVVRGRRSAKNRPLKEITPLHSIGIGPYL